MKSKMNLKEFVKETFVNKDYNIRPQIICNDGFKMSVQGSKGHYCSPRENLDYYSSMEIGYPTEREEILLQYAEELGRPTDTVYGWVPFDTIQKLIDKHGGININETFKNQTK